MHEDNTRADGRFHPPCVGDAPMETDHAWQFVPASAGPWHLTARASFDAVLAIYDEDNDSAPMRCVDDEDGRNSTDPGVTLSLTPGHRYYVVVAGFQSDHGQYDLHVTQESSATMP